MLKRWWAAVVAAAIVCAPGPGYACAVCLSATDEYREAFTLTTAILTALPLLMIGSLVFWLRRRFLRQERESAVPSREDALQAPR